MSDCSYQIRAADIHDLDRLTELLLALQDHVEAANHTLWQMTGEGRQNLKGQIRGRLTAEAPGRWSPSIQARAWA